MEENPYGLVLLFKLVFGRSADGAGPVIRKVRKRGPRLYTTVRVSIGRVVNVATNCANIFIHPSFLLLYNWFKQIHRSHIDFTTIYTYI
jgi:hypothetical protein